MAIKPRQGSLEKSKKRSKPEQQNELLYYGLHICTTLAGVRKQDIIRVYCTKELLAKFSEVLSYCASQRRAYHIVTGPELERITGSVHHEGVAILAVAPQHGNTESLLKILDRSNALLFLDGVQNPHNIGAIMRVMANFGWKTIVGHQHLPPLSAAAARMSEGGAEFVETFALEDAPTVLQELRKRGFRIVGTSSRATSSLYKQALNKKICLVMGHEVHGVSPQVEALFDEYLSIPGTGSVESLNVSVATGLILGEYTRTHGLC